MGAKTIVKNNEYENENAVEETLERLGVDHVDLLYIHQPAGNWLAGYRQLEKAYRDGKARTIGICNFEGKYMEELQKQKDIAEYLGIQQTVYSRYERGFQTIPLEYLIKLADYYGVSLDYLVGRSNDTVQSHRRSERDKACSQ